MADRFYVNSPLGPGPIVLEGPEAHHLAAVCRVRPGDRVCLFNGDGREYSAVVTAVARRSVELDVQGSEQPERELQHELWVAAPLPKGDRAQFLIEKLTELGAARFIPLRTARSVVVPSESKHEKLERHVIEASKQCGRNVLMTVESAMDWSEFCRRPDLPRARYLGEPTGDPLLPAEPADVVVAVGPEGGFTADEINLARAAGWTPASLGPRILRIETAALALAVLCSKGGGGRQ